MLLDLPHLKSLHIDSIWIRPDYLFELNLKFVAKILACFAEHWLLGCRREARLNPSRAELYAHSEWKSLFTVTNDGSISRTIGDIFRPE